MKGIGHGRIEEHAVVCFISLDDVMLDVLSRKPRGWKDIINI